MSIQILHNPRCSKSRTTLALLEEKGVECQVVEYLNESPSADAIKGILQKLGIPAEKLVRKSDFKKLDVAKPKSEEGWIQLMAENPILIERPIVINGNQAKIGRPPEQVLEII